MRNPCAVCMRDAHFPPYAKVNGFAVCSKKCTAAAKEMFRKSPALTMGKVLAAVAKRFDYDPHIRASIGANQYVQNVAQWICEEIQLRDPAPKQMTLDEGQSGEILLRNKDGSTSRFVVEAASHRLWMVER